MVATDIRWDLLANLGNNFIASYEGGQKRAQQARLADIGRGVADGSLDYRSAAGEFFGLGDAASGMSLLKMGEESAKVRFEVSASAAIKPIRQARETGSAAPARFGGHRRPMLDAHAALIPSILDAKSAIILVEIQAELGRHGVVVGAASTIHRWLRSRNLRCKKEPESRRARQARRGTAAGRPLQQQQALLGMALRGLKGAHGADNMAFDGQHRRGLRPVALVIVTEGERGHAACLMLTPGENGPGSSWCETASMRSATAQRTNSPMVMRSAFAARFTRSRKPRGARAQTSSG